MKYRSRSGRNFGGFISKVEGKPQRSGPARLHGDDGFAPLPRLIDRIAEGKRFNTA